MLLYRETVSQKNKTKQTKNDKCEFVLAKVNFQGGGYDQNTLYTCIKFSKNKLIIIYFKSYFPRELDS